MENAKKSLEQIEAERMSRRQALGRIGFLAGASAVAALTSDELLRKVGAEMQRRAGNNKIVSTVAKEFQAAGVSLASDDDFSNPCTGCSNNCVPDAVYKCSQCAIPCLAKRKVKRICSECDGVYNSTLTYCSNLPPAAYVDCLNAAMTDWCKCRKASFCYGYESLPAQCSDCPSVPGGCKP